MASSSRVCFGVAMVMALVFVIALPTAQGNVMPPAPAPTSDGTTIDQTIACVLMLLALVLTYLIHTFDAPLNY